MNTKFTALIEEAQKYKPSLNFKLEYSSRFYWVLIIADKGDKIVYAGDGADLDNLMEEASFRLRKWVGLGEENKSLQELILELKESARREHYYCEDSWYSCPKSEKGCGNDYEDKECNCGADKHNQQVEALYQAITEKL